jgi:hypothetical protein
MKNKFNIPITYDSNPYIHNCIDVDNISTNNSKIIIRYIGVMQIGIIILVKYKSK